MAQLVASLREYMGRVWQRGWAVIVSGIGGVLTMLSAVVPPSASAHPHPVIPLWLGLTLLIGGLFVAQFLAFHDVRKERNAARTELRTRLDAVRYRFEMGALGASVGMGVRPNTTVPEPGYHMWIMFVNGGLDVLEYEVESCVITLGNHAADPGLDFESRGALILPGRDHRFSYHWICAPIDPVLVGQGEYTVVYGHPSGGPRFRTHHKFAIGWHVESEATSPIWTTQGKISHERVPDDT
jgi:hypothetical protein